MAKETADTLMSLSLEKLTEIQAHKLSRDLDVFLSKCRKAYYSADSPLVSDKIFDTLEQKRGDISFLFPSVPAAANSVGHTISSSFDPVSHSIPMLSLDKSQTFYGIEEWLARLEKNINGDWRKECAGFVCEPKVDGLAISVRYENGIMVKAATRGDGQTGEDVTENVRAMSSIPITLETHTSTPVEIRGEIYIKTSVFEKLLEEDETGSLKSPRNTAAGAIRQKDPKVTASRQLSWFAFSIGEGLEELGLSKQSEVLEWLSREKMPVCEHVQIAETEDEIFQYLTELEETQHEKDFPSDGSVIKVNSLSVQKKLGNTSHHPRWAIAHKFSNETKETILEDIQIQIGPTGKATPVAILKPVYISESTVSRCTLSNEEQVRVKDVRPGDTVVIRKSGDVIPEILCSMPEKRDKNSKEWKFPQFCPCSRKAELVKKEGEANHYCADSECPEKQWREILRFCSRKGADIEGFGEEWIQEFYRQGIVTSIADLYEIPYSKKLEIDSLKIIASITQKQAERNANLIASIDRTNIANFSAAFIDGIGEKTGKKIAESFGDIMEIVNLSDAEIVGFTGIGVSSASKISDFMSCENNRKIAAHFSSKIKNPEKVILTEAIIGKVANAAKRIADNGTTEKASKEVLVNAWKNGAFSTLEELLAASSRQIAKAEQTRKFGTRQKEIAKQQLEDSLKTSMPKLLYGLNLPHVGPTSAIALSEKFGSIDNLMKATSEDIASIEGLGEVAGESIKIFFSQKKTQKLISSLKSQGMNMSYVPKTSKSDTDFPQIFADKTICVTGSETLKPYTRKEIHETIENMGGKPSSTVTKATNLVVNGNSNKSSRKLQQAEANGIEIIDGAEFLKIIANAV